MGIGVTMSDINNSLMHVTVYAYISKTYSSCINYRLFIFLTESYLKLPTCNKASTDILSLKLFALYLPLTIKVIEVKPLICSAFNYWDVFVTNTTVQLSDRL